MPSRELEERSANVEVAGVLDDDGVDLAAISFVLGVVGRYDGFGNEGRRDHASCLLLYCSFMPC